MQVCDHPFLLADFEQAGSGASDPLSASGKLVVLDKLLHHLHTNNHKVLLLSRYPKVDPLHCSGKSVFSQSWFSQKVGVRFKASRHVLQCWSVLDHVVILMVCKDMVTAASAGVIVMFVWFRCWRL